MTLYLPPEQQRWQSIDVRGIPMQACRLWEGSHHVESGLYRLPAGLTIPSHHHPLWCQVFVVHGTMEVQADCDPQPHTIGAGGFYFVELGDTHRDTALADTTLLVICDDDNPIPI